MSDFSFLSPLSAYFYLTLFFFHDTSTTEIYTLSLHDALPICPGRADGTVTEQVAHYLSTVLFPLADVVIDVHTGGRSRSEEHTSELQSLRQLVCRLLLEKKNKTRRYSPSQHSRSTTHVRQSNK